MKCHAPILRPMEAFSLAVRQRLRGAWPRYGMDIERHLDARGRLHRTGDLPAKILRDRKTGIELGRFYYEGGLLHRFSGRPAILCVEPLTGVVTREEYLEFGYSHCAEGPASISRHPKTGALIMKVYAERGTCFAYEGGVQPKKRLFSRAPL